MEIKQIINTTFIDLKKSEKGYIMIKDLSCSKTVEHEEIGKIKFTLFRSKYFSRHTNDAISLSPTGIEVASNFDTIVEYENSFKKSNKLKTINTIIISVCTVGMLILGVATFIYSENNKDLKLKIYNQETETTKYKDKIDSLEIELKLQSKQLHLKSK